MYNVENAPKKFRAALGKIISPAITELYLKNLPPYSRWNFALGHGDRGPLNLHFKRINENYTFMDKY